MRACHDGGLTLRVVQEAPNVSTLLSLVAAGMGVTFITSAAQHRQPDSVALRPVEDFSVPVSLDAVWLERNEAPALRAFIRVMASALAEEEAGMGDQERGVVPASGIMPAPT
jgi:DNA-binding transcriptional LysR family regulator